MQSQVASIRVNLSLTETEDTWEKISKSIVSFSDLVRSSSSDFPHEIVAVARELHRPINSAMKSERTRLSGPAVDLITVMAAELGTSFEPLLHLFFPTLLLLCARTSKVVLGRARTCVLSIIETTQLVAILSYFMQSIRDKSASLRVIAAEGTLACMNSLNPPDLEKEERTKDIEAFIKMAVRDANPEVRKIGKQIYQAYELLLPIKAESFASPLTPTSKKYLGVSSRPMEQIDGRSLPSSQSTSRPAVPNQQAPKLAKKPSQQALASSASSSRATASNSRPPSRPNSAADLHVIYPGPPKEARIPPQHQTRFVPVRPILPVSRSESSTATKHTRTVSTSSLTSGPIRYALNPLAHSASSKLTSTSAAPQRNLISSLPEPDPIRDSSKCTGGPLRVDPSAGRDCVPIGLKKPALPKLISDELPVTVVRPLPDFGEVRTKAVLRKPELPKLVGSSKGEASKLIPLKPASKQPPTKSSVTANNEIGADGTKASNTDARGSSLSAKLPSTASSRSRTVSTSASTLSEATLRPSVSRTRTISTSASTSTLSSTAVKPPASRARAASGAASSASAAVVAVARTRGITTSNSTGANVATLKVSAKPIWGRSSGTRSATQVPSKRITRPEKALAKQKRPSVVPEELEDKSAPKLEKDVGDIEVADGSNDDQDVEYTQDEDEADEIDVIHRENDEKSHSVTLFATSPVVELEATTEVHDEEDPLIKLDAAQEAESTDVPLVVREVSATPVASTCITSESSQATASRETSPMRVPIELVVKPSTPLADPQTPVRDMNAENLLGFNAVDGQPTPISALLSSIQRGFLFTPATPLSPPESYLPKEAGAVPIMPFPLFSNRSPQKARVDNTIESDTEVEQYNEWTQARQALEVMEIN